jgi:FkbM family methyltransferase
MKQTLLYRAARTMLPRGVWIRLARLPRDPTQYIRRFGWRTGVAVYSALAAPWRGIVEVAVPILLAPVAIRRGTSDVSTFEQVFVEQEYEITLDPEPATIVDAGANIGLASVLFATRYPRARIIAIEPDPGNFAMLERNIRAYPNVTAVRAALWGRSGSLQVANPNDEPWAFRVQEADGGGVDAVTVEHVLGTLGTGRIDLLKMDIEGAETEVMAHSASWIDRIGVLIAELHGGEAASTFFQAVGGRGFEISRHGENVVARRGRAVPEMEPMSTRSVGQIQ